MLIAIDAGHGGYDPGAVGGTGLQEKEVVLKIAFKVGEILKANNFDIVYTRSDDSYVTLSNRCDLANKNGADYFVSIHNNSYTSTIANGTETYVYVWDGVTDELAKKVQDNLVNSIGLRDRGVKTASFQVLRDTNMPAILVEVAFISNPQEEALLKTTSFIEKAAQGIAQGIMEHVGIQKHWGDDAIQKLLDMGLITSSKDPEAYVTWAEFATVVNRMLDYIDS